MPEENKPEEPQAPRAVLAFSPDAIAMLLEALAKLPIERALGLYVSIRDEAAKQFSVPPQVNPPA